MAPLPLRERHSERSPHPVLPRIRYSPSMNLPRPWSLKLKHGLDRAIAGAGLLATSPLFLALAVAIPLDDPGPVFFLQERVGEGGKTFSVFKFRTMVTDAESRGLGLNVAAGDDRITRTGRWLREWSLDELPQLINIVRGEMSLIGPRPTLPVQVARYTEFQKKRLLMRPGLTGWAQVNGRNAIPWEKRIELDVWYVENWSLLLDLRILLATPQVVLGREGLFGQGGVNYDLFGHQGVSPKPGIQGE